MTEDSVISYSRQKTVNRVFIVFVLGFLVVSLWLTNSFDDAFEIVIFSYIIIPIILILISAVFGGLSKRAIDYTPGEWKKEKIWVTPDAYTEMAEKNKDAFGHLYADEGGVTGCLCSCIIIPIFGILLIVFQLLAQPLFNQLIDSLLFVGLLDILSATLGFLWGFKIPKIDPDVFFKPPAESDVIEFLDALGTIPEVQAGLNLTIGKRGSIKTILEVKPKIQIQGLPDTASLEVQVSHSGFAYPYLVGTICKGPVVKDHEDTYSIGTRYPAIIEQSMDDNVTVYVARFNIPKKTSSVPSISKSDFRKLASLIATKMQEDSKSLS
ncbi:MAG: hypothetical protein ACFFDR_01475 [Candidatus Thorarchaeota archaeon]